MSVSQPSSPGGTLKTKQSTLPRPPDKPSKPPSESVTCVTFLRKIAEIRRKLEEAEENGGVVRLAEVQKRQEEENAKESTNGDGTSESEGEEDDEAMSPQLEEAVNVLADLVASQHQI